MKNIKRRCTEKVTVIGYGSQGRAIALNMSDSGWDVTVGLRPKSKSKPIAKRDKIRSDTIDQACQNSDIIIVAIPDQTHQVVLTDKFFTNLTGKPKLLFLHGSSIHFKLIDPPKNLPIYLLAPHAPGLAVRQNFLKKEPFSAFYSVYQGGKKTGYDLIFKLAHAIGIPKENLIKTTFGDEAIGDLFGEQAVLCGGLARLLKLGYETLVAGGLSPTNAYLEVAYQIDLIVDLVKQNGLEGMLNRISPMARYGAIVNGPRVIGDHSKRAMTKILGEIESGQFLKQADSDSLKYSKSQLAELTNRQFDRQAKKFKKK